jgi:hypothetical protein
MLALQSSPTLDLTKIGYLVGTILCLLGALVVVGRTRTSTSVTRMFPWLAASAALLVLIAISFFVARANAVPAVDWTRDIATYGLFAMVPIFALDAESSVSRRFVVGVLVVAGILGGLSWAVEWLALRDIVDLPLARLLFPTSQLPAMLYFFASAMAFASRRKPVAWAILAGLILGLFLITGTRSSLILLVGPLVMVLILGRGRLVSSARSMLAQGVVTAGVVVVFQAAVTLLPGTSAPTTEPGSSASAAAHPATTPDPNVLGDRVASLPSLVSNPTSDASIRERIAQYEATWILFASSPLLGVGPGHSIEWVDVSGFDRTGYTADTPLVMPAKFGAAGILVFMGFAAAYLSIARQALRQTPHTPVAMTFVGYAATIFVGLPLGFPVEDKGTSLALILLLSLALMELSLHARDVKAPAGHEPSVGFPALHQG